MSIKKDFSLTEVNRPEDWENLTDMAKKHVPNIEAPERVMAKEPFTVKVKIGGIDGINHPNTLGHWINWVEIYAGNRPLAKISYAPEMGNGYVSAVTATLDETTTLRARGFCNLHGIWEGKDKKVVVE